MLNHPCPKCKKYSLYIDDDGISIAEVCLTCGFRLELNRRRREFVKRSVKYVH